MSKTLIYLKTKNYYLDKLKSSQNKYNFLAEEITELSKTLYKERKEQLILIKEVESYINKLKNTPIEFVKDIEIISLNFDSFNYAVNLECQSKKINTKFATNSTSALGVAVTTTALAPSAAMAIATTFGTASTGVAISSLSGAAATNAALAWLGGGTLAAGGGGIAAGSAFLALAGPLGLAIGGGGLLLSTRSIIKKNKEISQKAFIECNKINRQITKLKEVSEEINSVRQHSFDFHSKIKIYLNMLTPLETEDYSAFSQQSKNLLKSLLGYTKALSTIINKRIS